MCGNFGLLLLLPAHRRATLRLLRKMLRITMIRGAQSAGIATYDRSGVGLRCRGHTRFATSSVCNIAGCHPHQWLPRSKQMAWRLATNTAYRFVCERRSVESFITHNGDCDAFTIHGNKYLYAIADLQLLLVRLLGHPIPSDVDSACVAGLLDMLRTKGVWLASVRYGYLFGALSTAGSLHGRSHELASAAQLEQLADAFAAVGKRMVERMQERFASAPLAGMLPLLQAELSPGSGRQHTGEAQRQQAAAVRLIECAVSAFLFSDLLRAALELLHNADGSSAFFFFRNQRDIDRARAAARAKAHAGGSSTLKDAEDHANKLRAKQAAAEERREAERAAAAGDQPATGQSRRAGGEAADADKREALRVAREAAEADLIREQEEARARSGCRLSKADAAPEGE
ncbi:hypothetical protein EMIHUDRAFT_239675 [Emiliania huxleyi CCMP1516]|uniref:Glutamine amidotransferase type-2 domain-containing protein n=2 Tax=Emiliania huxleyi TaxID=2903 RepID=A0A0D3JIS3_EMIH1|nr:hypothetical protein EMIHUDRAFT_239675 [Emiliania huxleyi CCMP1516]EOD23408.1 hypothetical protein EMIHUDRAFT_239675 [Emiliania huxleyi CCMP1516]|eukprot:XP_005775837.1 hypothetical protein EMIHUDRAFT_239675 [Emiliania huxleyi CCMP1516]